MICIRLVFVHFAKNSRPKKLKFLASGEKLKAFFAKNSRLWGPILKMRKKLKNHKTQGYMAQSKQSQKTSRSKQSTNLNLSLGATRSMLTISIWSSLMTKRKNADLVNNNSKFRRKRRKNLAKNLKESCKKTSRNLAKKLKASGKKNSRNLTKKLKDLVKNSRLWGPDGPSRPQKSVLKTSLDYSAKRTLLCSENKH